MMTAEQYFKSEIPYGSITEMMTDGDILYHAREFAKMHVKAALEAASESARLVTNLYYEKEVNKNSILNAYPLSNIK